MSENNTAICVPPELVICESCTHWKDDNCCIGVYNNCKVIVKPMNYDYMPFVIIVVPMHQHCPLWELEEGARKDLDDTVSKVAKIMVRSFDDLFPNFFTGGNINNSKYGLRGVHAHVHIEARKKGDPDYNTFPGHKNKHMLTDEELTDLKDIWKKHLNE